MDRPLSARELKCFVNWLEIPAPECPTHHYRLLGLPLFESNPAAIRSAVQRQIGRIIAVAGPDDRQDSARMQSFLQKVESGLLDAEMKAAYDAELTAKFRLDPIHAIAPPHVATVETIAVAVVAPAGPASDQLPVSQPILPAPVPPATFVAPVAATNIWPWVAGLMTLNTLVLALVVLFVVTRNSGVAPNNEVVHVDGPSDRGRSSLGDEKADPPSQPISPKKPPTPDGSGNSAPHVPQSVPDKAASGPSPKPSPPPKPTNPFADCPPAVQLPEVTQLKAENRGVELAALKSKLTDRLNLQLDNSAADFGSAVHFGLLEEEGAPATAQSWNVVLLDGEQSSTYAEVPRGAKIQVIARIFIDAQARLRFMWHPDAISIVASAQLANVVLTMSAGEWTHTVALRQPRMVERVKTHLIDEKLVVILDDLGPLPNLNQVEVEFSKIEGLNLPITIGPYERKGHKNSSNDTVLGETMITVGPEKELALPIQFVLDPDGVLSFEIRPKYCQPDEQMQPLSDKELGSDIRTVQRQSREWLNKYVTSVSAVPEVDVRIRYWQAQYQQLLQARNPNASAAKENQRRAENEMKKLLGSIRSAKKQLPNTYESLAHYFKVVRLASTLHASEGIEYCLYAKSGDCDIDLVIGNGRIQTPAPQFIQILNPGVEGQWFRPDADMAYEFAAGGGLTVRLASQLQQPIQGSWNQNGQEVHVTAAGRNENYTLNEDVMMVGPTGNLFKQF